jgi:putative addiction module CopG family antidote
MGHFIARCVRSGRFSSASEVVRAGIRLLQVQENNPRPQERDAEPPAPPS